MGRSRYSRPALHDLDRKLQNYVPRTGCFVEAGANDGFQQSNTYFLERFRSWTGILIEPIPELARRAAMERGVPVVNAALVSPAAHGDEITLRSAGLVSSVSDTESTRSDFGSDGHKVAVPGRTLSSILSEHHIDRVDFLSLDVEGHEDEALSGIDFDVHAPRLILVEIDEDRDAVESVLGPRYRLVDRLSFHDYLYVLIDDGAATGRRN